MSELEKSYYIGDPEQSKKRGQDKWGQVWCLLWLMIHPKGTGFAKQNEFTLGTAGGGIGRARSVCVGRIRLHAFAVERLRHKREAAEDELRRINDALTKLGDDPANLEKFEGPYKE